ncbi:MAG: hypothetical protein N4A64_08210 [Marinisporobacter sp.]|nr:hypothetical protein [Marinisporobacter sp.]
MTEVTFSGTDRKKKSEMDEKELVPHSQSSYKRNISEVNEYGYAFKKGISSVEDCYFEGVEYEKDLLPSGNRYKVIKENLRTVIAEFDDHNKIINRWMGASQVGTNVRGGHGDEIYIKLKKKITKPKNKNKAEEEKIIYHYKLPILKDMIIDYLKVPDNYLSNPKNFMYFDASEGRFISEEEWRDNIHYKERMELNGDDQLPATPEEAEKQGFRKLIWFKAIYHGSTSGNLKYVHSDGREAIYEPIYKYTEKTLFKGKITTTKKTIEGYKIMTFEDNPVQGPTYNYIDESVSSEGHFLFDMLPYYWWQGSAELVDG